MPLYTFLNVRRKRPACSREHALVEAARHPDVARRHEKQPHRVDAVPFDHAPRLDDVALDFDIF